MCDICGAKLKDDLFSFVTQEPVCSICKLNWIGGLPTTKDRIVQARTFLGLKDGEYLKQDNVAEARKILGAIWWYTPRGNTRNATRNDASAKRSRSGNSGSWRKPRPGEPGGGSVARMNPSVSSTRGVRSGSPDCTSGRPPLAGG